MKVECETCGGSGDYERDCPKCNGGISRKPFGLQCCDRCNGEGTEIIECPDCGGSGKVESKQQEESK